jgi:hypothetical protein
MPLEHSSSPSAFKKNVKTLMGEIGKSPHVQSRDQALAISYAIKRRGKAEGGPVAGFALGGAPAPWQVRAEARNMMHGPIMSAVPGRTDRHNVNVASGSYVLPADHVSHLGQNNTISGVRLVQHMFSSGPYGMAPPKIKGGPGAPRPPKMGKMARGGALEQYVSTPEYTAGVSEGGARGEGDDTPVPIVVAGGEVILPPEIVRQVGNGDLDHGHAILDDWVKETRKQHIATLKKLPPPAKS